MKDRRVRIGFIGAGWWATENHIPLLAARDDVELAGVCRLGREALEQVREHFGFPFASEEYRELLELELDGVVVTSPHHLHYEHAKAALERGVHVMCEKPLTLRPDEAWELVRTAQRQGVELLVPYGWHYKRIAQRARELVSGVGEVEYLLCHMASPTKELFAGDGRFGEVALFQPDDATWQAPEQGGGYAHGQITHSSGLAFWLTGLRAAQVSARMSGPRARVDLYDTASVVFENGALGSISGAGTLRQDGKFQLDIRIFGDEGYLILDLERERLELVRYDGRDERLETVDGEAAYSCEGPPARFVELLKGVGRNDSPGEVAARSVELVDAIVRSAAGGGAPVSVPR